MCCFEGSKIMADADDNYIVFVVVLTIRTKSIVNSHDIYTIKGFTLLPST